MFACNIASYVCARSLRSRPRPCIRLPDLLRRRRLRLRLRLQQPRRPLLSALVLPPPQYSLFPSPLSPAPLPSFLFPRCAGAADAWPIRQGSQAAVEYTLSNPSSTPKPLLFPTALSSSNPLPWVSIKRRRRREGQKVEMCVYMIFPPFRIALRVLT